MTQDAGLTVLSRMSQYWFVQWQWLLWPPGSVGASTRLGQGVRPEMSWSATLVVCVRTSRLGGTSAGVCVSAGGGNGGGGGGVSPTADAAAAGAVPGPVVG